MATEFHSSQTWQSGEDRLQVRRREVLEDQTFNTAKTFVFWIAVLALAIGLFLWGRSYNGHDTAETHVYLPADSVQATATATATAVAPPQLTCEDRCRARNTGDAARMCIVKRCDP